jgi:hypothetical protein
MKKILTTTDPLMPKKKVDAVYEKNIHAHIRGIRKIEQYKNRWVVLLQVQANTIRNLQ